jgi:hypothetical protein
MSVLFFLFSDFSSNLQMEEVLYSETALNISQAIQRHTPEEINIQAVSLFTYNLF